MDLDRIATATYCSSYVKNPLFCLAIVLVFSPACVITGEEGPEGSASGNLLRAKGEDFGVQSAGLRCYFVSARKEHIFVLQERCLFLSGDFKVRLTCACKVIIGGTLSALRIITRT